mmetsp:Transcript_20524/g.37024  ORF Transcript_20524/g.37024 Transcript_20524/m.37024 type:complete len:374 (-) Transcript_20524:241-1362(-)
MKNAAARGANHNGNCHGGTLKNKRLAEIRKGYKEHKLTPQERHERAREAIAGIAGLMGSAAGMAGLMGSVDSIIEPEEDPRDKLVSSNFSYNNGRNVRKITITSEGSRHWRQATVKDSGSIVYLPRDKEFGEFDDLGEEPDEEFPDDGMHTTAIVSTFSGNTEEPWAFNDKFEELLIVPEEVLEGVKNEAPPGRFFSGKSITASPLRSTWSPAPDGKTWMQHPFLKDPNGTYLLDEQSFYMSEFIECPGMRQEIMEKVWKERGALAYWCPVLKQFLSEGERLRQEHWFHNGDGSAQQRYFYDQNEMLDIHGGLDCLPMNVGGKEDIFVSGVMGVEESEAKRVKEAEAKGEIVEVDMDSKIPAVPDKKKRKHPN